jgi:hypothetical protein
MWCVICECMCFKAQCFRRDLLSRAEASPKMTQLGLSGKCRIFMLLRFDSGFLSEVISNAFEDER